MPMAEPRREDESEGQRRDVRDVPSRVRPTDHPERTKPEHLHSSPGPLSSIRAAIKRTRTNPQCEHTRDRRRPQITIVSAEPLDSNNWFPGPAVVFPPPPPPPPQSGCSAGVQAVSQVIQEKTQEGHAVRPTAAPRCSTCIATSATQTDPVRGDTTPTDPRGGEAPQSAEKRSAAKKPQKPPRPSLPRPGDREPVTGTVTPTGTDGTVGTNTTASTNAEDQSGSISDIKRPSPPHLTHTSTRSVTVYWDIPANHLSAPAAPAETTSPSNSEPRQCPVPLPRTRSRKPATAEEVKVQPLVEVSENCDTVHSDREDFSSNKYLKELLEAFSAEDECEQTGDIANQSDEACQREDAAGEMNAGHSQRNIRARIQAFESQADAEEGSVPEPARPEPRPRKATAKPPVAAKPSVALKPQFNHSTDEDSQNFSSANVQISTPRPQPPEKIPGLSIKEELESIHSKAAFPNRSRPSVLTRANSIYGEETSPAPPVPPAKPFKEPLKPNLNINNHNSASISESEYVNSQPNHIPAEPPASADSNGASFKRQTLTRRPTTIRVPSKTGSLSDSFQDGPPPLPVQKPVGSHHASVVHRQVSTPVLPSQESFQFGPEPSLPPRRPSTTKTLPPRPPPAKPGPGRPPPPGLQATGRSHSTPWDTSPKPQAQKPHRKPPVLPPRPNPGHRLYNKYTLELPHGIAALDFNGSNTGELSLQKNEVLLLLGELDHDTFECQVGDVRGRVHKSRMKVITPLAADVYPPQRSAPSASGGDGYGQRAQATHDFIAEGPGELGLRAGDVVTMVEPVDSDWSRGTCRGSTGFFPVNYVKVLSDSPKRLPERKPKPPSATASGPRCVARFDFEGEHSDELSFSEGDVIQLKELMGQDWARGQMGTSTGIFPLNFVEVIEDLPPPASRQQTQARSIPLPGMVAPPSANTEIVKPAQVPQPSVEWAVALYDYAGKSKDDLSFREGDRILITQHVDADWSCGRLDGREGMFPRAFVESSAAGQQPKEAAGGSRARALFNFTAECDEELSLQIGDIITDLESIDEEWFLGDLRGTRALVPRNYVQVLG
ncbi:SH3 domain-containing protein 19 isoform X3 [Scophthalmus maximus]|uniref:SH3 domain-containing protein 19 isoform X3 n=1 Tax=Scophthalmus maximus TaxID=52904 RepID=UPI001FA93D6D|nr:SH3 domain-containing protein 19 isoform X3 [Scophthalmus maximus]